MKTSTPNQQEIAQKAYQIYVRNGCRHGHALDHWLEAEAELRKLNVGSETKATKATNGTKKPTPTAGNGKRRPAVKKTPKAPR
ncbi:MAG: DUF2934 domain-containing protein [Prosthecobacter sp.]|nr:DUF2934 domain-containing protein [Prosthecobacter sp.]